MFTFDPEKERQKMVEKQLRKRGIVDRWVLAVMGQLPREEFLPSGEKKNSYHDGPLPIGHDQTISQPYMVALMSQTLALTGEEKVLEIGTGSGYQTAVLAKLSNEVFSMEIVPELATRAEAKLAQLEITNINIFTGDGSKGWPENAPYDCIMVTAGAPQIPETLKNQLAPGGRMVIPVGDRQSQTLYLITRSQGGKTFTEESILGCVFVPLLGQFGWAGEGPHH